ncbi:SOS response-associated peptidase [Evansella sp. AB-rgal1]|uniref:SOS response-associated peptidase n=1 Tax=Evansella sp. AB-rgal1 TaxID=3242696 RepID=UPI00359CC07F
MCGRFTLYADPDFLLDYYEVENREEVEIYARYNIAPSQQVLTMVQGKTGLRAGYMKWGLVPRWAQEESIGNKMINARSETIQEKVSFRPLVKKRHCIIVANGFYEWKTGPDKIKQPYYIKLKSNEPMAFAGLWERWQNKDHEIISCTLLTTEANSLMRPIHERMPVILPKMKIEQWLKVKEQVESLFSPYPKDEMEAYPVSTIVNTPQNDHEICIQSINENNVY